MDMVWMVTTDTWTEGYGSTIYLVGIFDSEQEADDAVDAAHMRYETVNKYAVELNNRYDLRTPFSGEPTENAIYLGGYIE